MRIRRLIGSNRQHDYERIGIPRYQGLVIYPASTTEGRYRAEETSRRLEIFWGRICTDAMTPISEPAYFFLENLLLHWLEQPKNMASG